MRARELAQAARDAAAQVASLEQVAKLAGPDVPLAAWPVALQELDRALSAASRGLYHASLMASAVIGPDPALPDPGAVPGELAIACARATGAASLVGSARDTVLRELRRTDTGPDTSSAPLWRHAARARDCLDRLDEALKAASRPGVAGLAGLTAVTFEHAEILGGLSRTCGRARDGVAGACGRLPGATPIRTSRASGPLRRASDTLQKAAAVTSRARLALDEELARARKERGGARC